MNWLFQDFLKHSQFDILFVEQLPVSECYKAIAWRRNIPIIGTAPFELRTLSAAYLGNPYHPAIIPNYYSSYTSRMTFVERLINTIETMYLEYIEYRIVTPRFEKYAQKYFPEDDLKMTDISLLFLNHHPSLFPLPYVLGIVEVGGIHLKPPQILPKVSNTLLITLKICSHNFYQKVQKNSCHKFHKKKPERLTWTK